MRTTANSILGNQHATIKDLELKTNASFWEMPTTELLPSDSNSVWQFFEIRLRNFGHCVLQVLLACQL